MTKLVSKRKFRAWAAPLAKYTVPGKKPKPVKPKPVPGKKLWLE